MKVPVATGVPRSAAVRSSIAAGGGNTKGKKKKPSAMPKIVPSTPPSRKILMVRHMMPSALTSAGICRRIGDARRRVGIAREAGRDPGLLGGGERGTEVRTFGHAAGHQVRGLERKARCFPSLGQTSKLLPRGVTRV